MRLCTALPPAAHPARAIVPPRPTPQVMLQVTRGAPAWRGVLPMLPGGDLGMDASCTFFGAAAMSHELGASLDLAAGLDLVGGTVRLPRLGFASAAALGAAAAGIRRGRRVTCAAGSAAADLALASARVGTPQGEEAARQLRSGLDESFRVIESRSAPQQPHHPLAQLLNTRLGDGGGGAAPEAEEEEGSGPRLAALAPEGLETDADAEGWCAVAAAVCEAAAAPTGEEALLAGDAIEAELRWLLGVRRLPRLSELEGYRVFDVGACLYFTLQTEDLAGASRFGCLVLVRQGQHGALSLVVVCGRRGLRDDVGEQTLLVRATI